METIHCMGQYTNNNGVQQQRTFNEYLMYTKARSDCSKGHPRHGLSTIPIVDFAFSLNGCQLNFVILFMTMMTII